ETLESTESVSLFLDAEGLSPQTLTVQFGYFTRLQSWAPILIPVLFFVLGNGAGRCGWYGAEWSSKRAGRAREVRAPARDPTGAPARRGARRGDPGKDPPGRDDLRRGPAAVRPRRGRALTRDGPGPPQSRLPRPAGRAAPTPGAGLAGHGPSLGRGRARSGDRAGAGRGA